MGCDVDSGPDRKIPKNLVDNEVLLDYNLRYVSAYDHYEYKFKDRGWAYIFSDHITNMGQITDLIYRAGYNSTIGTVRQSMEKFYKK